MSRYTDLSTNNEGWLTCRNCGSTGLDHRISYAATNDSLFIHTRCRRCTAQTAIEAGARDGRLQWGDDQGWQV